MGEFGRRWTAATPHSDIDSDYRRDLATSSTGLHQEARSRDGGQVTSSWTGGRLSRGSSKNNVREEADIILRSTTDLERSNSNSAREEERRKVLEIEGVIRQPQTQLRANVTRSASRASRTAQINNAGPRGYKPGVPRHLSADVDRESQYSGHSSSQTVPLPGPAGSKLNRFDQHRVGVGRVRRSTSNANAAAMGGVRQQIQQRKTKLPGKMHTEICDFLQKSSRIQLLSNFTDERIQEFLPGKADGSEILQQLFTNLTKLLIRSRNCFVCFCVNVTIS